MADPEDDTMCSNPIKLVTEDIVSSNASQSGESLDEGEELQVDHTVRDGTLGVKGKSD
jgi:hypothetical protein